jgi:hypothetical protein
MSKNAIAFPSTSGKGSADSNVRCVDGIARLVCCVLERKWSTQLTAQRVGATVCSASAILHISAIASLSVSMHVLCLDRTESPLQKSDSQPPKLPRDRLLTDADTSKRRHPELERSTNDTLHRRETPGQAHQWSPREERRTDPSTVQTAPLTTDPGTVSQSTDGQDRHTTGPRRRLKQDR